jgi:ATP-dependent DNA helicase RecG
VWGIEDQTFQVLGTSFQPRRMKVGSEELENWLATQLDPRIHFQIEEFEYSGQPVVIFEIQSALNRPVGFRGVEYIRVGTYRKPLKEHPEKERLLWARGLATTFEREVAAVDLSGEEVLSLLDHSAFSEMNRQPLPDTKAGLLDHLSKEKLITRARGDERWDITNLGAVLFAKALGKFEGLARKAVRVIVYKGKDRIHTLRDMGRREGLRGGIREPRQLHRRPTPAQRRDPWRPPHRDPDVS